MVGSLGTSHGIAVQRYMNARKVPQLFVATGATRFGDPKAFPWTMGWQPTYQAEGKVYALHILQNNPNAKIAVLMQNDDFGKDFHKGFMDALGEKAKTMVVSYQTYEVTDPTIDSQMVSLKGTGADTFFNITTPKFAAQAIKKAAEIGWKPQHYLNSVSASVGSVMIPAGADNGVGIITASYLKDPTDPQWQSTQEYKDWLAWMQKHHPSGDLKDANNVFGYVVAQGQALVPTFTGFAVSDFLVRHFSELVDLAFTRKMEGRLDDIAGGDESWREYLGQFYSGPTGLAAVMAAHHRGVARIVPTTPVTPGIGTRLKMRSARKTGAMAEASTKFGTTA